MTFSLPAATTITLPPPLYSIFLYSSVTFISRMNSSPSRLLCCSPMSILCILDRHPHETSIPWIPELSAQPSSPFYCSQTFYPSYPETLLLSVLSYPPFLSMPPHRWPTAPTLAPLPSALSTVIFLENVNQLMSFPYFKVLSDFP